MIPPYFPRFPRCCAFLLSLALSAFIPAASGQQNSGAAGYGLKEVYFPSRDWLPPVMADPTRLSANLIGNDEFAAVARDGAGRIWVVWATCRPAKRKVPAGRSDLEAYEWSDQGEDSIMARYFDGQKWSPEQPVSGTAGVNYRPVVLAEPHGGVRILWTARRNNAWGAWERRWTGDRWEPETQIPGSDGALEIAARVLTDGSVAAVTTKAAPPNLQLDLQFYRNGRWSPPERLDQGEGRCHRPSLLELPNGAWIAAWDEERGGNYDIYARRSGAAVERLTDTEVWDTTPALARTADGRIWIAWERKETIGGRAAYRGRSIFGKYYDGSGWQWAPSPYAHCEPGQAHAAQPLLGHRRNRRGALPPFTLEGEWRTVAPLAGRRARIHYVFQRTRLAPGQMVGTDVDLPQSGAEPGLRHAQRNPGLGSAAAGSRPIPNSSL